jgi:LysR family cys regulon transcriptional activator
MELRHLKTLSVLSETDFNVTNAANKLCVVQSAVSHHLAKIENDIGIQIFMRKGKQITGLTAAGNTVLEYARQALAIRENILAVGKDYNENADRVLRIGATHTQARYVLPAVIRAYRKIYPAVRLHIYQDSPMQLVQLAIKDKVDFSICTESLGDHPMLITIPCYQWNRSLVAPKGHPILKRKILKLKHICEYPIITYTFGLTGAGHTATAFTKAGLSPEVTLSAMDTDIIKTYVREGLGVGLIASMAYSAEQDSDLELRDLSKLLPWETTWIAYHKDKYLQRHQLRFIKLLETMVAKMGK